VGVNEEEKMKRLLKVVVVLGFVVGLGCIGFAEEKGESWVNNPGFEEGILGWDEVSAGTQIIDEAVFHSGKRSVKVIARSGIITGVAQFIPYNKEGQFLLSGYVKTDLPSGAIAAIGISYYTKEEGQWKWLDSEGGLIQVSGKNDWKKYSAVFPTKKVPEGTQFLRVWCYVNLEKRTFDGEGCAWFDDISITPLSGLSDKEKTKGQEAIKLTINEIENKISELGNLLSQAEQKKIDVSCQKITKNVAELLLSVFKDAENNPAAASDSCLKTEMEDMVYILDKSIAETKYLLANPQKAILYPDTEVKDFRTLKIENGAFYVDGRPTFINGINIWIGTGNKDLDRPSLSRAFKFFKQIGANLLGPIQNGNPKQVAEVTKMSRDYNIFVYPWLAVHWVPNWQERYKGIRDFNSHNLDCDPDHPLLEEFIGEVLKENMKYLSLKENPNILFYASEWETILWGNLTDYGRKRYAEHLKEKYGDIANLNQRWHTDFSSFEEAVKKQESMLAKKNWEPVLVDRPKDVVPERWYDWHSFQQSRLDRYFDFQTNTLKKLEPSARFGPGAREYYLPTKADPWPCPLMGKNLENRVRNCRGLTLMAVTIAPFEKNDPNPFYHRWTDEDYFLQWLVQSYYYDFIKSIAPENGIFDPEHHQINGSANWFCHAFPKQSAEYTRDALYLAHLHGLVAHSLWAAKLIRWLMGKYIPRDVSAGVSSERSGYHIYNMPIAMDAWARTMLDLKRLAPYVILFPQAERKVRILYSEASVIQEYNPTMKALFKVYENLYFLGTQVGFITEKMIEEGKLKDCSILVIPQIKYVEEKTYQAIKSFISKGGKVVLIGDDCLKYDETGMKERDTREIYNGKSVEKLPLTFGREYFKFFDSLLDKVGIKREVKIRKGGAPIWGIEARSVKKDGKLLFYVINLNTDPEEFKIETKTKNKKFLNLITNEVIDLNKLVSLKPGEIILGIESEN